MNLVGKMLAGRYEILEEIGKGGMAYVYKARCHFLNRYVALKILKDELRDDKEFVHRFNTEAQAAAKINNPHVVGIHDVGFENGLYYIVMEYIEGKTLKEYIGERGSLPWREAAEFAAQICEGLDAAHKKNVIHRDIKPQNIIMASDGVLKVTDFGIARATSQVTTTASNSTIGTVHYLSPEQARGGYTSERTDIYSLGVVLYEMLTGRLPFDDNTAVAIAIKHIQEKPVLPRILNKDIPEAMEYIVMKAMNKEQNLRYQSAEVMLNDLQKVLKNPNVILGDSEDGADNMSETRKRDAIGENEIREYERKRRTSKKRESGEQGDAELKRSRINSENRKRAIREHKKKERRVIIGAIVAAIVLVAGLTFIGVKAINGGGNGIFGLFTGGEKTEIPNVVGMNYEDAVKKYKSDGFSIVKVKEELSDKEPGTILQQDPPGGYGANPNVNTDMMIKVIVSAGNKSVKVDDYSKMKVEDARRRLTEKGFTVNEVEKESSSEAKGTVISQEPLAGTDASPGSLVTLYVSKGDGKDDKKEEEKKDDKKDDNKKDQTTTTPQQSQGTTGTGTTGGTGTGTGTGGETSSGTGSGSGTSSGSGTGTGSGSGTSSGTGSGSGTGSSSAPSISD